MNETQSCDGKNYIEQGRNMATPGVNTVKRSVCFLRLRIEWYAG